MRVKALGVYAYGFYLPLIALLAETETGSSKDITGLFLKFLSPRGTVIALICLGIFTVMYTSVIRYFFDRRLKASEQQHSKDLERLKADFTST